MRRGEQHRPGRLAQADGLGQQQCPGLCGWSGDPKGEGVAGSGPIDPRVHAVLVETELRPEATVRLAERFPQRGELEVEPLGVKQPRAAQW